MLAEGQEERSGGRRSATPARTASAAGSAQDAPRLRTHHAALCCNACPARSTLRTFFRFRFGPVLAAALPAAVPRAALALAPVVAAFLARLAAGLVGPATHRGRPAWGDQAVCRCRVALVRFQLLTALLMRGCPLLQVHPPIDANCAGSACRRVRNRAGRAGQAHPHLQAHLRRCLGPTRACPPRPPHRPAPPSQQQLHPPLPPRCLACRRAAAPLGRG